MLTQSETAPRPSRLRAVGTAIEAAIDHHQGRHWRDPLRRAKALERAREALRRLVTRRSPQEVISALSDAARLEGRFARKPANDAEPAPSFVGAVLVLSAAYGVPVPEGQGIEPKRHMYNWNSSLPGSKHGPREIEPGGEDPEQPALPSEEGKTTIGGWRLLAEWKKSARVICLACGAKAGTTMRAFLRAEIKRCAVCVARAGHARSSPLRRFRRDDIARSPG